MRKYILLNIILERYRFRKKFKKSQTTVREIFFEFKNELGAFIITEN